MCHGDKIKIVFVLTCGYFLNIIFNFNFKRESKFSWGLEICLFLCDSSLFFFFFLCNEIKNTINSCIFKIRSCKLIVFLKSYSFFLCSISKLQRCFTFLIAFLIRLKAILILRKFNY